MTYQVFFDSLWKLNCAAVDLPIVHSWLINFFHLSFEAIFNIILSYYFSACLKFPLFYSCRCCDLTCLDVQTTLFCSWIMFTCEYWFLTCVFLNADNTAQLRIEIWAWKKACCDWEWGNQLCFSKFYCWITGFPCFFCLNSTNVLENFVVKPMLVSLDPHFLNKVFVLNISCLLFGMIFLLLHSCVKHEILWKRSHYTLVLFVCWEILGWQDFVVFTSEAFEIYYWGLL